VTKNLTKLLAIASEAIAPAPARRPKLLVGPRGDELWALLEHRNGWYAFEGALHVLAAGARGPQSLERWNSPELWRGSYADLADGCVFFAEDIFGGQFALADERVWVFDPETGEREQLGETLDAWARAVLGDFETLTGQPIAHAWQTAHGPLGAGKRLAPKTPFVAGGEFALSNLYAADAVEAMRFRGDLAQQIRNLPDGAKIELKITE